MKNTQTYRFVSAIRTAKYAPSAPFWLDQRRKSAFPGKRNWNRQKVYRLQSDKKTTNRYPPVYWGFYRKGTFGCLFVTAPNGTDINPVVPEILHNV